MSAALSVTPGQGLGKGQGNQHIRGCSLKSRVGLSTHQLHPTWLDPPAPSGGYTMAQDTLWTKGQFAIQLLFLFPDSMAQHLLPSPLPLQEGKC